MRNAIIMSEPMREAHGRRREAVARGTVLFGILLARCSCAFALNPALDVSQYAHTSWKIRDGFTKGVITAIAQTPDGYLWLGTEFGLVRFDGVRPTSWEPPAGQHLPNSYVRSLLAARDGTLWIGTARGLASVRGGKLTRYAELAGQSVWELLDDREGTVWASVQAGPVAATGKLCAFHNGNVQCYGEDGRFGPHTKSLYEDRGGNLWVGAMTGLWRWKPGPPKLFPMPDTVQALTEGENATLAIATLSGIRQFLEGKVAAYPLPVAGRFSARAFLRDRDGGLWIGTTDRGLVHVHQGRTDVFERFDGLSSDFIERIYEDSEGDIWVATLDGLDRFRGLAVPTISVQQGLSNATVESVLAARDGSVWLGTLGGLNRLNHGRITVYRKRSGLPDDAIESLFQDDRDRIWVATRRGVAFLRNDRFTPVRSVPGGVHSITGDRAGNLWISQNEALFRLRGESVVERIPLTKLGHQDWATALVADPSRDGLWIAFRDGGVAYFEGGEAHTLYTTAGGLGAGHVWDLQRDREGRLWAATQGGVSLLKDGSAATLRGTNGLPCDDVHSVMEDDDHFFWLYMACGLVRVARGELDAWAATANQNPRRHLQTTLFDASDGVRSHSTTTGYSPSVAKSTDGRIWFLPWDGVSVVDPCRLPFNRLPPPVHIEQITADRKTHDAASDATGRLELPPLVRDLEIDYTALSLVAPEKVFFRYKLEGWDRDWLDVGNRRQAFYSNLSPRNYRFSVKACNNSGVWSEASTFLDFSIAPARYQTTWFRLSCVTCFLALLGALYQLRLRQVERQFNVRLEERLAERTRIAQELHDTLLQGFVSASMHVDVATSSLPEDSKAKRTLIRALEVMRQVIDEGRDAVRGLRSHRSLSLDLEQALSQVPQELPAQASNGEPIGFRVVVEGQRRT